MILPFREMAKRVLEKQDLTAASNTTQLNKVLDWINLRYDRIVRSYPWPEIIRQYNLTLTASTTDYSLQRDVDEIVKLTDVTNGRDLPEITPSEHAEFIAPFQDVTGNITTGSVEGYIRLRTLTTEQAMTIADTIQVLSSNNNDDTPNAVRVCGLVSGIEICENLTLTGTTAVESTNTYDSGAYLRISVATTDGTDKDIVGNITVREKTTTANTKAVISPSDWATEYHWIRVFPQPESSGTQPTIRILYRKRVLPMINVLDVPEFDCSTELIQGAYADLLRNDKDPRSDGEEARFNSMVQELMKKAETEPNYIMRFTPKMNYPTKRQNQIGFMGSVPYSGVV